MVVALLGATLTGWNWVQGGRWRDAVATGLLIGTASAFKPTALIVVVPIVAAALWSRRSVREVAGPALVLAALAVAILPLSYLPLGTVGPARCARCSTSSSITPGPDTRSWSTAR
ncbi:glycosyltransferase family 39 protein [Aquihabitans daechungensis]|uniref:glycosyltransferase family 39 protein n=1 Tax=Aquihabitans daechungensis TaxID=1052257 RepID=UPI003BA2CF4B